MARSNQFYSILCSALTGIIAAIATVTVSGYFHKRGEPAVRESQAVSAAQVAPGPQYTTVVVHSDSQRLDELQKEVQQIKTQQLAANQAAAPPNPEESRQKLAAMFAELDRRQAQDPPDPSWSPAATRNLEAGLNRLSQELGFAVRSSECKTAMCRATVEWKDYAAARQKGLELTHRTLAGLNCVQTIWLKEPNDPEASYSANLYLDCTSQRAGLVEAVSAVE